jgi:transcriptional regulator with XRE-family HTH domain
MLLRERRCTMSTAHHDSDTSSFGPAFPPTVRITSDFRPLHQLGAVRRREGFSRRAIARRLGADVRRVRDEEEQSADMPLSRLYQWQAALGVPVAELLVDSDEALSPPVLKRAQILRLMKTAAAIRERADSLPIQRMAQMLVEQILEIMPELKDVSPWNAVGQRRTLDDLGQAAYRRLSLDAMWDLLE